MRTIPFLHDRRPGQSGQDARRGTWRRPAWGLAIATVAAAATLATAGTATAATATATVPAAHAVQATRHVVVSWPLVQKGDRGQRVVAIQYLLNEHGISLTVDGVFGDGTDRAVRDFQRRNNLPQDGKVGPATWMKLVVLVKKGSRGSAVQAVQSNLSVSYGYHYVTVDGVFGDATDRAVRDFQRTHPPFRADGVVGMDTWQALVYFEK
jgi:peptidoglycan hydrolase-like protein with peptidoglycan-binding domain